MDSAANDELLRLRADFANYRRRAEAERATDSDRAVAAAMRNLLGVLDDLDRAEGHGELVGGFAAVAARLRAELAGLGLDRYGSPGDSFDPTIHHAVAHLPTVEVTEPVCLDVVAAGYTFRGHPVRPAHVAVATPVD